MDRKILVLENQRSQFDKIKGYLNNYDVYPKDYSRQMDLVRIAINPKRYFDSRSDNAFDIFYSELENAGIELILLDYKLSGPFDGDNGIEFAQRLRKKEKFADIPIIFLSRTPKNDTKIMNELQNVTNFDWVEKSYFGENNLENVYFNRHVLKLIVNMLGLSNYEKTLRELDELFEQGPFKNFLHHLAEIREKAMSLKGFSEVQRSEIADLHLKQGKLSPHQIETAINKMRI